MNMTDKKIKLMTYAEITYLVYFIVMLGARAFGLYEGMVIYNITLVIGMILFICKVAMTEHTVFEYGWMGILLLLSLVVYHNTGEKGLLVYFTMMLGVKNVSMKHIFKVGAVVWTVAFGSMFLLTIFGVINDTCFMHEKHGIGYVICHSMGYPHPNVFHIAYLVLTSFILYLLYYMKKKEYLCVLFLMMAGNVFVFLYSFSFTGFIATTILLIFGFYFKCRKKISIFEKICMEAILPVCILTVLLVPPAVEGDMYDLLNKVTNTRLALSRYFLTQQPITMLGSRLVVPNYRYTMDCSYVYLLVQLGIVAFAFICIAYICLIHHYIWKEKRKELALIFAFCIAGTSEPFMFNLAYKNLIFLFLGQFLFEQSGKISEKFDFLNVKIQILRIGSKYFCKEYKKIENLKMWIADVYIFVCKKIVFFVITFIIASGVAATVYVTMVPKPEVIYVDGEVNIDNDNREYLTPQMVQEIRENGGIVKGYTDASAPMYAYYGNTVIIEYGRNMLCIGLLSGMIFCVLLLFIYRRK